MEHVPMPKRQTVSVIVCAYTMERLDAIRRAVASVHGQSAPVDEIVVVVDHNGELEHRLKRDLTGVTVIANDGRAGLSSARNCGVRESVGDLLLFLDDDAELDPDWVRAMLGQMVEADVLGLNGRIIPDWASEKPRWFPDEFLWVVGCTMPHSEPGTVRNLFGAAMCIKREVFSRVGRFDQCLGRSTSTLPGGCEETEFCIRATRSFPHSRFLLVDGLSCRHLVTDDRSSLRYLCKRCFAEGISKATLSRLRDNGRALSVEWNYASKILPLGILSNLRMLCAGDGWGGARACIIALAFMTTVTGFIYGRLFRKSPSMDLRLREAEQQP
jgi:glucosyl-dolichyl phosphate glucuronosyltransferase